LGEEVAAAAVAEGGGGNGAAIEADLCERAGAGGIVWLAEVESGFDERAESPAGALGCFN